MSAQNWDWDWDKPKTWWVCQEDVERLRTAFIFARDAVYNRMGILEVTEGASDRRSRCSR